jgi:Ricin-type beta-trefoil lectin domain-like/Cellulase (glycosyl hydrolase family 5)
MSQARQFRLLSVLLVLALAAALGLTLTSKRALAATSQLKGVNWADQRDNFVNGVLYPSGLSSSDTYSSASTVASRVVGQLFSITGANTVRMPINEPTVADNWSAYTGAIDEALTKGNVILAYWAYSNGKPASTSAFYSMWDTVINKYGSNPNAYFEVINEPYGYSTTDLDNMYNTWLTRYPNVSRGHVILDGTGYATNAANVGSDSRLNNTLIGIHDYTFFVSSPYTSESQWESQLSSEIGSYASRTLVTEWGAPMSPGSKDGVSYGTMDYSVASSSNYFIAYVRGISSELRSLGVGSVYWPGLRDGDWYSMTTKSGSGSGINLTLVNSSGLARVQYAWGIGSGGGGGGGSTVRLENVATGLYMDGMGRTSNGSDAGQYSSSGSTNQQWVIQTSGSYVTIQNVATGLYLDGMGRTSNGSNLGQWSGSGSTNQQWTESSSGGHVTFKNRATGLFIDGMGRTSNGSAVGQYSQSSSSNQQWEIVSAG